MATSDDEDSVSNIDFSVISSSIDLGRPMLDQVVNGIHYGSPEIRNLLRNECDLIIECKICRNFFRSFPNFVAHKRVYCLEMNADKLYNNRHEAMVNNSQTSETVVVEPSAPEDSSPIESSQQATTVEKLMNGSFQSTSSAFRLYTDVAEEMERQKANAKNTVVKMTPIASNSNAVVVTVTQEKNKESCECDMTEDEGVSAPSLLRNILERPLPVSKETQIKGKSPEEKNENSLSVEDKKREGSKRNETRKPMEDLRPVQSNLGSANRSFLSELSKKGLCHIKTLECLVCNKQMSSKKTLWNHMKFFHLGEKTVYPCLFCDKTFGRFYNISKHIMSCHDKSHKDIEKLKSKIKSLSYKIDDSGEELSPSSQKDTEVPEASKSEGQTVGGIKIINCEGCKKAFWKKETYASHTKQCKALNPCDKVKESVTPPTKERIGKNTNQQDDKTQCEKVSRTSRNTSPDKMSVSSESSPEQSSNSAENQSKKVIQTRHTTVSNQESYMKTRFLDKRRAVLYESPKKSSASITSSDSSPKLSPKKGFSPRKLSNSSNGSDSPLNTSAKSSPKKTMSSNNNDEIIPKETDAESPIKTPVERNLVSVFEKVGTRSKSRGKEEKESKASILESNNEIAHPIKSQDLSPLSGNVMQTRQRKSREDKSKEQDAKDKCRETSNDSNSNKNIDQKTTKQKTPSTSSNTSRESSQDRFIHTRKSKQLMEAKKEQTSKKGEEKVPTRATQKDTPKMKNMEEKNEIIEEEIPQSEKVVYTNLKNVSPEEEKIMKMRQKMQSPNKHIFAIQGKVSEENKDNEKEEETTTQSEDLEEVPKDTEKEEVSRSRRKQVISVRQFDEVDGGKGTPVSKHNTRRSVAQKSTSSTPNTRSSSMDKKDNSGKKNPKPKQEIAETAKQKIDEITGDDPKEKDKYDGEKRQRLRSKADWNSVSDKGDIKQKTPKQDEVKDIETAKDTRCTIQTRGKSTHAHEDKPESVSGTNIVYTAIQPKAQSKIWKSPNANVVKIQEIWVKKKPGQPTEEVKHSTITVRKTSTAQRRLCEKYRHPKRVYVMKSKKSTKPVCLDMNNIESLLDREKKQCKECGIQLKSMSNLRRHIVRHLGWKRYKCKLCPFSSFNRSECNSHLQRIHKEKIAGKDINNLIKDLKKEGSEKRLQKKQQTLRTKQRLESEMAASNSYKKETKISKLKISPHKNVSLNQPVKSIITTRRRSLIQSGQATKSPAETQKLPETSKRMETVSVTKAKSEAETTSDAKQKNEENKICPKIDVKARKCIECSITFANDYNLFRHVRNIHKFDTSQLKKSKNDAVSSVSPTSLTSSANNKKISKDSNMQDDTASIKSASSEKSARKRKRQDSGTSSENKLKKTDSTKSAPEGRKRSASLDGSYNENDSSSINHDLYDNLCSVSDNENDFNDRIGSPTRSEEGMIRLEPRVQTMFAALEEARATVRQRGKKLGIRRLSSPVKKVTPSPTDKKVTPVRSSARIKQESKTPSTKDGPREGATTSSSLEQDIEAQSDSVLAKSMETESELVSSEEMEVNSESVSTQDLKSNTEETEQTVCGMIGIEMTEKSEMNCSSTEALDQTEKSSDSDKVSAEEHEKDVEKLALKQPENKSVVAEDEKDKSGEQLPTETCEKVPDHAVNYERDEMQKIVEPNKTDDKEIVDDKDEKTVNMENEADNSQPSEVEKKDVNPNDKEAETSDTEKMESLICEDSGVETIVDANLNEGK
ncbi:microtubule-associated protein futsch-like [Saccostrea echinata]|uniref:microtubule-associated protein futsch-like n=1 Tax=Saccostrea echinata TaxID=191078 RepID=UPI002A7F11A8|nr:microtubule-associated protein futsch-like [Saccostrea echinata]